MKKYKIKPRWNEANILEREITRETDKCVFYMDTYFGSPQETRENKVSDYGSWYDTWEEAHAALLESAQSVVVHARRRLEEANGFLGNVKGMQKPKTANSDEAKS